MNDYEAVAIHLAARAESGDGEMSDGAARTVASWWHDGQSSAGYAFVSTGAIVGTCTALYRELAWPGYDTAGAADRLALDWLGTYLLNRADYGPVAGWSGMWVR